MGTLEDRLQAARAVKRRKIIAASLAFFAFGPLPLILTNHLPWAGLAVACFLIYACFNPAFCAPSREEIIEMMLEQRNLSTAQAGTSDQLQNNLNPGWTIQLGQPSPGVSAARSREGPPRP